MWPALDDDDDDGTVPVHNITYVRITPHDTVRYRTTLPTHSTQRISESILKNWIKFGVNSGVNAELNN